MGAPPEPEKRALDLMRELIAELRALPDRDHALNMLIESIEDDWARLLSVMLESRISGRTPPRTDTAPFA